MNRFAGKVVLVTGAAAGIGASVVQRLRIEGAKVACVDVRPAAGQREDDATLDLACDVSDETAMASVVAATLARFGQIDAAVLNAGIEGAIAPLEQSRVEDFDRVYAVNARGVFLGIKLLIPALRKSGGGSIVAVASTAGLRGSRSGTGAYAASKHAVIGLVKTAALEAAIDGVRVNAVCPSPVDTRMMRAIESGNDTANPRSVRARIEAAVPLGRYAQPDEIASLVTYLLSDEARYLTGGSYLADGGVMAG